MSSLISKYLKFIIFLVVLSACSLKPTEPKLILTKSSWDNIIFWSNDKHLEAFRPFLNSCEQFKKLPASKNISNNFNAGSVSDWLSICDLANSSNIDSDFKAKLFFENYFNPYSVKSNDQDQGLFTGYYEIDLTGSLKQSDKYKYPIYKSPKELNLPKYYLERKHLNNGFLTGRNLELLYVDNEVDLFFLHIQGSGKVYLDDGSIVRVGYSAQNGHPYIAIGKYLISDLKIDRKLINADFIRNWLSSYKSGPELMELNPSYVFFKINDNIAPIGSFGNILTPERSLAVDKKFIPLGVPLWLETTYPADKNNIILPFHKLVIAHDTGGAIKGIVRGDVFFGNGNIARYYASNMKQQGRYFILLPKSISH
ncbi:MAG: murein transglycosylase A [Alphaproteobacteria bacterium]